MFERFIDRIPNKKLLIIVVSALATVVIVNEVIDFTDKIRTTKTLLLPILSLIIFYFFAVIAIQENGGRK